jgi:putative RNA 2'-phosphotransferase
MGSDDRQRRISKYLSFVLRHDPASAGLALDERGAAAIEAVVAAATGALGFTITRFDLEVVAEEGAKRRFEIEGDFIRAGHGHSFPITGYERVVPARPLFHGAPASVVPDILAKGLLPMTRDKVHLAYDRGITIEAARRKAKEVSLVEVVVDRAIALGVGFYRSADPRIVLSDAVPGAALRVTPREGTR